MKNEPPLSQILRLSREGDEFYTASPDKDVTSVARSLNCGVVTQRRKVIVDDALQNITWVRVTSVADGPLPRRKPHILPGGDLVALRDAIQGAIENLGKHTRPSPLDDALLIVKGWIK